MKIRFDLLSTKELWLIMRSQDDTIGIPKRQIMQSPEASILLKHYKTLILGNPIFSFIVLSVGNRPYFKNV